MVALKDQIEEAFAQIEYPGDDHLRGSSEGEEPFLLEEAFTGRVDWRSLSPAFLDSAPAGFSTALLFFSPEAFRFYLPAYLLADLSGQLRYVDVVFALTHGLTDATREMRINPSRFGELTWFQYVRDPFSEFTGDQAQAVLSYLTYKRSGAMTGQGRAEIDEAVDNFWMEASCKV